mgnify:CR=1 FL=1
MRKALFPTIIIIGALLLIARIFYLQIIDDSFKLKSDNNAIKIKYDYPERGYIYDRNGKLLVANQPSYDIMVIPRDVKKIDTTEFCDLLQITKEDFIKKIEKAKFVVNGAGAAAIAGDDIVRATMISDATSDFAISSRLPNSIKATSKKGGHF